MEERFQYIDEMVKSNPVILFMKGTPQFPQCGFSSRTSQALMDCGEEFAYVNIFQDAGTLREDIKEYAKWPTFPQLYVDGELVGGCDITIELYESGELKQMITEAKAKVATTTEPSEG